MKTQRPRNMFLSLIASGLLALGALLGATAPAMAMDSVPNLSADPAPTLGALLPDISAGHLIAQPPGDAFQALDIFENTILLDVGADTELISAAASPDTVLMRSDGHVFDDWPAGIAQ